MYFFCGQLWLTVRLCIKSWEMGLVDTLEHLKHCFTQLKLKKNYIIGVGNPDEWSTQNCLPRDCLPVGNPEVGNLEGNPFLKLTCASIVQLVLYFHPAQRPMWNPLVRILITLHKLYAWGHHRHQQHCHHQIPYSSLSCIMHQFKERIGLSHQQCWSDNSLFCASSAVRSDPCLEAHFIWPSTADMEKLNF